MVIKKQAVLRVSGVAAAVAVAVSPVLASAATSNTTINATIGQTLSMSSTSAVNLSLTPGSNPVTSIGAGTVSVSTNNTTGYNLSLANSDTNTSLVSGGNDIAAHSGTHAAPTTLADNTWGYAMAGASGFDLSYTVGDNQAASVAKFAGVPPSSAPQQLKTTTAEAQNDTTTVHYGVRVDSTKPTGTYTDTVTYTAVTN